MPPSWPRLILSCSELTVNNASDTADLRALCPHMHESNGYHCCGSKMQNATIPVELTLLGIGHVSSEIK